MRRIAPSFDTCRVLLAPAIVLHNAEEFLTAPAYGGISRLALNVSDWPPNVAPPSLNVLRLALVIATILPVAIILMAIGARRSAWLDLLVCVIATLYLVNAFLPHLVEFILYRAYGPGLASAVLINIPLCSWLLRQAVSDGRLSIRRLSLIAGGGIILTPILIMTILIIAMYLWGTSH